MAFQLHAQLERDTVFVMDWPLSQVRLHGNATLPWLILVPRLIEVVEIHHLATTDRNRLCDEINAASALMEKLFAPDKINIGLLGNLVPQLHIHIVGRFRDDPSWPGPVWGSLPHMDYTDLFLKERLVKIKAACNPS